MSPINERIKVKSEEILNELFEFLRFESISSAPEQAGEVRRCADWLAEAIGRRGFGTVRIVETPGHPIVYAEDLSAGKDAPTVLIYGHYDVQPVDPLELWETKPFEPTVRDGKIYCRGSADDKGQLFIHLSALSLFEGRFPVNIKLVFEGEEEANESHLDEFIINNSEMLACDCVLISDTEWFAPGLPTICVGLRGISFMELKLTGPNRDLHSGTYGGAVQNPLFALATLITKMKNEEGRILIPGFYDDVRELTEAEREDFRKLPFDEEEFKADLGVDALTGESQYSPLERLWARPTLELNGIYGGYQGEGNKTIIPSYAVAKFTMRLVPNQDPEDIRSKCVEFAEKNLPAGTKVEIKSGAGGRAILVERDNVYVQQAVAALREAFGTEPAFMRDGGSIPVIETFKSALGATVVLMGMGLPGDNIHSPNESFSLDNFFGGIEASWSFLKNFSK